MKTFTRDLLLRIGLGPFQRFVDALSSYGRYGAWLKEKPVNQVFGSRHDMYNFLNAEVLNGSAVDYLEFGVYQGASIKYWSELNQDPASRFFGFDSFRGLPEAWPNPFSSLPKGAFDTGGNLPEIDDPRVSFVEGYFQDSLPPFLKTFAPRNRLVIHCDADIYSSTLFVLCSLHPLLKAGTLIVFDEFGSPDHEFRAFLDYKKTFLKDYRTVAKVGWRGDQIAFELACE